jgi:glycine/D-amino acid oxidase-like deaminating enzyme
MMTEGDAAIIGGGFFGAYFALKLARAGRQVLLFEAGDALMQRASRINQARVHHGYHYPRCTLTALRSRENYQRFVHDFSHGLNTKVEAYYSVATQNSKINAEQFYRFIQRIGAPIRPASRAVHSLFDPAKIEETFIVEEAVFDSEALRLELEKDLEEAGVQVFLQTKVQRLDAGGLIETNRGKFKAKKVLICAYAFINEVLENSGLPQIDLRYELTEMALVQPPAALDGKAFTVMCGPFFSLMPYPTRKCYTLSHVRYTPHFTWTGVASLEDDPARKERKSQYTRMMRDVVRYFPIIQKCQILGSLFEIKTLLPKSDHNDGRPILVKPVEGRPDVVVVMGGKIDNVYDAWETLKSHFDL